MSFIPSELIKKKKFGGHHSRDEIRWIVQSFTSGAFKDYQLAAWAMAVWFNGMNDEETAALTDAMFRSGSHFDFSHLNAPRVDKHSTGGVGDKTSLIVGPILAAAQVYTPMISGRGLGHTGGTLDKLESIPGFRVNLSREEFEAHVVNHYFSVMGQTEDICPADKKLYALRDVTSTVDSLPLICASIMSKKLAESLTGLVLDVKCGSGALMKTLPEARRLAALLKATGEKNGLCVKPLITNMNEPLGRFVGNAVEVQECYEILQGRTHILNNHDFYQTTRELSLELAAQALLIAKKSGDIGRARILAAELLVSGAALRAFEKLLQYQGPAEISKLPTARFCAEIKADRAGFVTNMQTERIGLAAVELGCGRRSSEDDIDPSAGIELCVRLGDEIQNDQILCRYFSNSEVAISAAGPILSHAIELGEVCGQRLPLIPEMLAE